MTAPPAPPRASRRARAAAWAVVLGAIFSPVIMAAAIGVLVMLARYLIQLGR